MRAPYRCVPADDDALLDGPPIPSSTETPVSADEAQRLADAFLQGAPPTVALLTHETWRLVTSSTEGGATRWDPLGLRTKTGQSSEQFAFGFVADPLSPRPSELVLHHVDRTPDPRARPRRCVVARAVAPGSAMPLSVPFDGDTLECRRRSVVGTGSPELLCRIRPPSGPSRLICLAAGAPSGESCRFHAPPVTCATYCALISAACKGPIAAYATEADCLSRCAQAPWQSTAMGPVPEGLRCRHVEAQRARDGLPDACADAGFDSPRCTLGQKAPEVPRRAGDAVTVLGLYDGTDAPDWGGGERCRKVILEQRVGAIATARGLRLVTHDISRGLPTAALLRETYAVVTCYFDGAMSGARGYVGWMAAVIDSGRPAIILNDFGAYQESKDGSWLDPAAVNLVLGRLGVNYRADWTGDPKLLKAGRAKKESFRQKRPPDPKSAKHYYRFDVIGSEVVVHFGVTRTDRPGTESAVVFTSPKGGMALTRYYETQDGAELIDLDVLLRAHLGASARKGGVP